MLADVVDGDQTPSVRAEAANLLGVLRLVSTFLDPPQATTYLTGASERFRRAIALAPEHEDAKYNLDLTLLRLRDQLAQSGSGGRQPRAASAPARVPERPGSGY